MFPNINVPEQSYLISSQIYCSLYQKECSIVTVLIMNLLLLKKFYYYEKMLENGRICGEVGRP